MNQLICIQLNCHKSLLAHNNTFELFKQLDSPEQATVGRLGCQQRDPSGTSQMVRLTNGKSKVRTSSINRIAFLQEPFCPKGKCPAIDNMKLYKGANDGRVRACIYASANLQAIVLSQFSNGDMVTI